MTIRLNLRSGIVLVAVLVVIGAGIAYAAARISREVTGAFVVGNVQTTDETILLYSQLEPLTALEEILIPTEDVDAFGFFVNRPRVPFWVANGGGVGFELTVMGVAVEVIRGNEVIAAGEDILSLVMGPAGEELRPYPDNGVVFEPNDEPFALEMGLVLRKTPGELGLQPGDTVVSCRV